MSFSCIHYGVRYIPKSIFPSVTSQAYFFQVATPQMCNFPSRNFLKVRLGPLMRRRLQWGPSAAVRMGYGDKRRGYNRRGRWLRLGQTWEVAAWEIVHLGSFHLGKILCESTPLYPTLSHVFTTPLS